MAISMKKPGGASRGRAPSRRAINFADVGKAKTNYLKIVPYILIFLVAAGLFAKFGVIDILDDVSAEEQKTVDLQTDVLNAQAKVLEFGSLADEYEHFTFSRMTPDEITRVDRVQILDLIRTVLIPRGVRVESWSISGNTLTIYITARDMVELGTLKNLISADPRVDTASLTKVNSVKLVSEDDPDITLSMMNGKFEVYMKPTDLRKKGASQE